MNDEKYGIIVCPDCQNARSVDLTNKTTKCTHCGKLLKIKRLKKYYKTDSQKEACWAVGMINAKIRGEDLPKREKKQRDPYSEAIEESRNGVDERERLLIITRVLTKKFGKLNRDDLTEISERLGYEDVDKLIKKLRKIDEIYEPKYEIFKAV